MGISRRDLLLQSAVLWSMGRTTALGAGASAAADARGFRLPDKNPVRTVENEWIAMSDGTQLSARLWLPESADAVPVVW